MSDYIKEYAGFFLFCHQSSLLRIKFLIALLPKTTYRMKSKHLYTELRALHKLVPSAFQSCLWDVLCSGSAWLLTTNGLFSLGVHACTAAMFRAIKPCKSDVSQRQLGNLRKAITLSKS